MSEERERLCVSECVCVCKCKCVERRGVCVERERERERGLLCAWKDAREREGGGRETRARVLVCVLRTDFKNRW